jgi:IclR family acetate operon transcriptional repressor
MDSQRAGISCVAVAVTPRAAIAVAGPSSRLPKARLVKIGEKIRQELDAVRPANQEWL